jgi:predicted ATPase
MINFLKNVFIILKVLYHSKLSIKDTTFKSKNYKQIQNLNIDLSEFNIIFSSNNLAMNQKGNFYHFYKYSSSYGFSEEENFEEIRNSKDLILISKRILNDLIESGEINDINLRREFLSGFEYEIEDYDNDLLIEEKK